MVLDIYRSILKYAGLTADDDGFIYAKIGDKKKQIEVDGLSLVLPTSEQLKNFNKNEKMLFHPLAENILQRGEPPVIKKFKDVINIRLNYTIGIVAQSLLNIVVNPELHKQLTADQAELLMCMPDTDAKTLETFISQMLLGMKSKPDRLFNSIFLKKGGMYNSKKHARVGIVMFPFFEKLSELKCRKKDIKAYDALFKFMFPEIDVEDSYNFGSNSRVAPYLDSLMSSSLTVASKLNDLIITYENHIDESESLIFDADWVEHFQDLENLLPAIRRVPAHQVRDDDEFVPANQPEVVNVPAVQQQQVMPTQQVDQFGRPIMSVPQMQAVAPTELLKTSNGLDFKSLMQSTPALHNLPNPLQNVMQPQMMQQQLLPQQTGPSWAVPDTPQQMPVDQFGRPIMQQQPSFVDQYNRPVDQFGRLI